MSADLAALPGAETSETTLWDFADDRASVASTGQADGGRVGGSAPARPGRYRRGARLAASTEDP